MKKILIICYVCADFVLNGNRFSVKPNQLGAFIEAPEWIKNTIMFKLLVKDGSLKVSNEHISKKQGENDPMQGMSAEGKKKEITEAKEKAVIAEQKADDKPAGETEAPEDDEPASEEPKAEEKPKTAKAKKPKADDAK